MLSFLSRVLSSLVVLAASAFLAALLLAYMDCGAAPSFPPITCKAQP